MPPPTPSPSPAAWGACGGLRADARVAAFARALLANGKLVAAICASPLVLSAAGILADRRATCYPGLEDELDCREFVPDEAVVEDRSVVTSQGPGTTFAFALHLLARLAGDDAAAEVAGGMLLR
ncbi:MAG: DJ-1/PfpI family protein [Kiritimatiellia bacterium]